MRPGDVVVGTLPGAERTKIRPAVVLSSESYLASKYDVIVALMTTHAPRVPMPSDCYITNWELAGLRSPSYFRGYVLTVHRSLLTTVGRLAEEDWLALKQSVRSALAI